MIAFMIAGSTSAYAEDPTALRAQADAKVKSAAVLMQQADQLSRGVYNRNKMQAAMEMYIQAGKAFEMAANVYSALVPQYATENDVHQAREMMQRCIRTVKSISNNLR